MRKFMWVAVLLAANVQAEEKAPPDRTAQKHLTLEQIGKLPAAGGELRALVGARIIGRVEVIEIIAGGETAERPYQVSTWARNSEGRWDFQPITCIFSCGEKQALRFKERDFLKIAADVAKVELKAVKVAVGDLTLRHPKHVTYNQVTLYLQNVQTDWSGHAPPAPKVGPPDGFRVK